MIEPRNEFSTLTPSHRFVIKQSIEERVVEVQKMKYGGKANEGEVGDGRGGVAHGSGRGEDAAAEADRLARQQREQVDEAFARRLAEEQAGNVNVDKLTKAAVKVEEWDHLFGIGAVDLASSLNLDGGGNGRRQNV